MKKLLAILLVAALVISFAACGGNDTTDTQGQQGGTQPKTDESAAEDENILIEFDNIPVYEDDNVKIDLTSFYEETIDAINLPEPKKYRHMTLKIHNKTDYTVSLHMARAYIGDEEMQVSGWDGTPVISPSKTGTLNCSFEKNTLPERTPLASIDELYQLDGTIMIVIDYDPNDGHSDHSYNVPFSIAELFDSQSGTIE